MPDYELARYFHTKTALREVVSRLVGRNRENGFVLQETGIKFLLADPLAEGMRAFRQEVLETEPTHV
jgi:hypothetical protein